MTSEPFRNSDELFASGNVFTNTFNNNTSNSNNTSSSEYNIGQDGNETFSESASNYAIGNSLQFDNFNLPLYQQLSFTRPTPRNFSQFLDRHRIYALHQIAPRQTGHFLRQAYCFCQPSHVVHDVQVPLNSFIRKFSPNGRYLVCFSRNQHSVQLYELVKFPSTSEAVKSSKAFSELFKLCWEMPITRMSGELLCMEFCLFPSPNHLLLASVKSVPLDQTAPRNSHFGAVGFLEDVSLYLVNLSDGSVCDYKSFESDYMFLSFHACVHMYEDLIGIISVQKQVIHIMRLTSTGPTARLMYESQVAKDSFANDEIQYQLVVEAAKRYKNSNNAGNLGSTYVNTSTKLPAAEDEEFADLLEDESDELLLGEDSDDDHHEHGHLNSGSRRKDSSSGRLQIHGVLHQVMVAMYKKSLQKVYSNLLNPSCTSEEEDTTKRSSSALNPLYLMFYSFEHLLCMKMWKFQFLDFRHMLIKFTNWETITGKQSESQTPLVLFVVYDFRLERVIAVLDNSSEELLKLYGSCFDLIRGNTFNLVPDGSYMTSCANNLYERGTLQKQLALYKQAKSGGPIQATRRVLSTLPIPPQTFHESPYFDQSLFIFDEKLISAVDRPRTATVQLSGNSGPINQFGLVINDSDDLVTLGPPVIQLKFYRRENGSLLFRICNFSNVSAATLAGNSNSRSSSRSTKRYVTFIFHPFYPLAISIQHGMMHPNCISIHIPRP